MALAGDAIIRAGAAQRDALIDGDIVADHRGLADHHETVIDEEVAPDHGTGMDIDRREHPRPVVDQAREKEQLRLEQPMRDTMIAECPDARIGQDFKPRPRRGIARLDRIEIGDQPHVRRPPLLRCAQSRRSPHRFKALPQPKFLPVNPILLVGFELVRNAAMLDVMWGLP
jgi:hypothetical protein